MQNLTHTLSAVARCTTCHTPTVVLVSARAKREYTRGTRRPPHLSTIAWSSSRLDWEGCRSHPRSTEEAFGVGTPGGSLDWEMDPAQPRRPWTTWLLLTGAVITLLLALALEHINQPTAHGGGDSGGGCPLGYGSHKPRTAPTTPGVAVYVYHDARIYTGVAEVVRAPALSAASASQPLACSDRPNPNPKARRRLLPR